MSKIINTILDLQNAIYNECNFKFNDFTKDKDNKEYYAHNATLEDKKVIFRLAKKTPIKIGWFAALWTRRSDKTISPYTQSDPVDFIIIAIKDGNNYGHFMFPKAVLVKHDIFRSDNKKGKRALRVYTPMDKANNPRAIKTQKWQAPFYIDLKKNQKDNVGKVKAIYTM